MNLKTLLSYGRNRFSKPDYDMTGKGEDKIGDADCSVGKHKSIQYQLFDAFVDAILLQDRVIDFSANPICINGSIRFVLEKDRFSKLLEEPFFETQMRGNSFPSAENMKPIISGNKNIFTVFNHFQWIWSLGMVCPTKAMYEGICENAASIAFPNYGLWSGDSAMSQKPADFCCLLRMFNEYYSLDPVISSVAEAKILLERICLEDYRCHGEPIHNGILHFCNPNDHIHIYAKSVKKKILEKNKEYLENVDDDISVIDAKISIIFDKLSKLHPDMEYENLMRQCFYQESDS